MSCPTQKSFNGKINCSLEKILPHCFWHSLELFAKCALICWRSSTCAQG